MANKLFNEYLGKYQSWGLSIIPIAYKTKRALVEWQPYQKHRPEAGELGDWFSDGEPKNIGIVCGRVSGNLVVLDFDREDRWAEWLRSWDEDGKGNIYTVTPVVKTARGYQVYMRTKQATGKQRLDGLDIQGEGSYVVAPPSIHSTGTEYKFINPDIDRILEIEDLSKVGIAAQQDKPLQSQRFLAETMKGVAQGERNSSAFNLALTLKGIGTDYTSAKELLLTWNSRNAPPLQEKELESTLRSAYSREAGLTQAIRDFVNRTQGTFTINQLDTELGITAKQRGYRKTVLFRFVEQGLIERIKPGHYRIKEPPLPDMDWRRADIDSSLDIKLPFGIHELVELFPKNILVIAGVSNAGKTGYLLNFVKENMAKYEIHYFTSELSEQELKKRLNKFGDGVDWQFHAHERNSNFDGVIVPHAINVIDYLEPPSGEFFAIGDQIKAIHERLTTGIAFIAIQKKKNAELGRGAEFSLERARLYLSLDNGKLKIVKAKNWKRPETNPNGMVYTFKLVDGCKFRDVKEKTGDN